MGIIKASKLIYDYIRRDEDDHVEEVKRAIDDLTLDINQGDFVAILGHNGSGKSTLAKHMNALLTPTAGKLWVEGLDTADPENLLAVRGKVGMVFQNPDNQIVASVVEEDVAFGPENLGVPPAEIRQRVDTALHMVGMYDLREHSPHLLSGGQKQRVAIAGIIAMMPRCIVLDEATASLDVENETKVQGALSRLLAGKTVLVIAHRMRTVEAADKIVVLADGKAAEQGSPTELMEKGGLFRRMVELQRQSASWKLG